MCVWAVTLCRLCKESCSSRSRPCDQFRLTLYRPDSAFQAGVFPVFSGRHGHIRGDGPILEAILPPCRESIVHGMPSGLSFTGYLMRRHDEDRRLHHGVCRRGPDHGASEADVRGGEASAVPCLRTGCPDGGRGERGIFLIISFSPEGKVYRLLAGARGVIAPTYSSAAAYCGD
jgi:hypothetical protein